MPELPDIELYVHALKQSLGVETGRSGETLLGIRLSSPFLLRSVSPSPNDAIGARVVGVERLGKRIVIAFDNQLFFVFHLMIAGRLRWGASGQAIPKRLGAGALDFAPGSLILTEASKKKRASLYVVEGRDALAEHHRGGVEPLEISRDAFAAAITERNHTLKRALTDPRILSGIGNAYSDEILYAAKLSPVRWTSRLTDEELTRLYQATQETLRRWLERLREETGDKFPEKVTAFRPDMAVHGKYGKPCPACGSPVQRIAYADNETNYCATCQTGGKLLADRSLSRLLKGDWPRTLEELEKRRAESEP